MTEHAQSVDSPGSKYWHSPVEAALVLKTEADVDWMVETDAIVVGVGGAGICAGLEMIERGLDVIAIDRFDDGGATGMSGGVYYGGGTRYQAEAGYPDTAEEMYKYLSLEISDGLAPGTLERFCRESSDSLEWLEKHGAQFSASLYEPKVSYPPEGHFLYYSGNERVGKYAAIARPAPRGHRTVGEGITGHVLWGALRRSLTDVGGTYLPHCPVRRLIVDEAGCVLGVEIRMLPQKIAESHNRLFRWFNATPFRMTGGPIATAVSRRLEAMETRHGVRKFLRAKRGVVLATGGYVYNRRLAAHFAPHQKTTLPLGTIGCDGSGIRLAQTAGARLREIGNFDIPRQITPPPCVQGVVVNGQGERFVAEDGYSATVGHKITFEQGGIAWIIVDRQLRKESFASVKRPRHMLDFLWQARILLSLTIGSRKGRTLEQLAKRCGFPVPQFISTVEQYNRFANSKSDPLGKMPENLRPLGPGPYYAINISSTSRVNAASAFSLGGLDVDENSGQVLGENGSPIGGLFAAGRVAYGVCSRFSAGGLSIADCVFSGRRAGRSIAQSEV